MGAKSHDISSCCLFGTSGRARRGLQAWPQEEPEGRPEGLSRRPPRDRAELPLRRCLCPVRWPHDVKGRAVRWRRLPKGPSRVSRQRPTLEPAPCHGVHWPSSWHVDVCACVAEKRSGHAATQLDAGLHRKRTAREHLRAKASGASWLPQVIEGTLTRNDASSVTPTLTTVSEYPHSQRMSASGQERRMRVTAALWAPGSSAEDCERTRDERRPHCHCRSCSCCGRSQWRQRQSSGKRTCHSNSHLSITASSHAPA